MGALRALQGAISKAEAMGVPQCIAVVDPGGHLLAFARMDGAKTLSIDSATAKAVTAAPSSKILDQFGIGHHLFKRW